MASNATTPATNASTGTGARNTKSKTIGMRTTAVSTRLSSSNGSAPHGACRRRIIESAITAVTLLIIGNAFEQVHAAELRPQCRRDVNFRISQLPKQKIAQPHLAAGANYKIGVGQVAGVEMPRNCLLVDLQMLDSAIVGGRVQHGLKCVHQLRAGAI